MASAELVVDRELTLQLHRVLSDIDPVRWRDEMPQALHGRLADMRRRMSESRRLAPVSEVLATELPALPTEGRAKRSWLAFKQRMQPVYARLAESLRADEVHVPSLRPTNHARSLFHLATALLALGLIEVVSRPWLIGLAAAWAAFAWGCEVARRLSPTVNRWLMTFFKPVAHQHETIRVNSATWYATALVGLALVARPELCAVAVMVLGVGDPVAALIGRRFGRVRLVNGRSLEGSVAFFVSAAASCVLVLRLLHPGLGLAGAVLGAVGGALAGAVAELFSTRVDDNLSIPWAAALGAWALLALI